MTEFDSITSNQLTVEDGKLSELVMLVGDGSITAKKIRVNTDEGVVTIEPEALMLNITTE